MHRVWDEILEQARLFFHGLTILADQLDPLADDSEKDTISILGSEELGADV